MKGAVYNEIDPFCAEWLRRLIMHDLIAPGDVDERSILDVSPDDWRGYAQVHAFAGIGIWSYALREAGWPDDRPVWTGSCPCQPFSAAGKGGGFDDERHLWPAWHWLLRQYRPDIVLGEQVASKAGLGWFDLVSSDLEGEGYAVGAADTCAAGVGAPHIRQRLYWLGFSDIGGEYQIGGFSAREATERTRSPSHVVDPEGQQARLPRRSRESGSALADDDARLEVLGEQPARSERPAAERGGEACTLQHPEGDGREQWRAEPGRGSTAGFWREADWIACRDGKWRPVEPGTFPLASGIPGRVGLLRAYGNGLCAPVATAFIEAVMDCIP